MKWVLILTLYGYNGDLRVFMQHIPNFSSADSCITAGNMWIKNIKAPDNYISTSAVCVQQ